jgi:integration host factor subunit beta
MLSEAMPTGNDLMTKSELIEAVSERTKLPKGKAELIVNCIFDSMVDALKRGEGIEIRGFGSFTVREYKSYEGRNPRTGQPVHVQPKRLPFFKVGKELRERVNESRAKGVALEGGQAQAAAGGTPPRDTSSSSNQA